MAINPLDFQIRNCFWGLGMIAFWCFFFFITTDKTVGCKNFQQFFEAQGNLTLVDCNIECCSSNRCNNNTHVPWLLSPATTATTGATLSTSDKPAAAGHPSRYSPTTGVLAIAAIFGVFFLLI